MRREEKAPAESAAGPRGRWQPELLAWAPAERLVGVDGSSIAVVDAGRNEMVTRRTVEVSSPSAIAVSPDGARVLVADASERGFLLWDVRKGATTRLNGHHGKVVAVAMSRDGKRAASVSPNGTAMLWDLNARKQVARVEISDGSEGVELSAVAVGSAGRRVALGTVSGNVCIWNPGRGNWTVIARHDTAPEIKPSEILPAVKQVAFTPDGQFVVSGGQDQYALLTDPDGKLEGSSAGPYEYVGVQALAVSPKGDLLAFAHADGIDVVRYRLASKNGKRGAELTLKAHIDIRGGAQAVAFSPNGQRLAASVNGEGVSIWELATGESYPLDPK